MTGRVPLVAPEPDHPDRERLRQLGEKVRRRLAANKSAVRIQTGQAELWGVSGFFTPGECAGLIALIDAGAQPSKTYFASDISGVRTSYSTTLDERDSFVRPLQRRIDTLLGLDRSQGETLQGQRYLEGQEFITHTDWFQQNSPAWARERDRGGQRCFTAMAYLNNVDEGGETDFPELDLAVTPRQGLLLVWNNAGPDGTPNPYTVHAGNPVRRGSKYIITRWYRCRQFRAG